MIERYDINDIDYYGGIMNKINDGDWVKYEDYEKLENENEELKKEIEYLKDYISDETNRIKGGL